MNKVKNMPKTGIKISKNKVSEFIETKFGSRAVSDMNKSRVIALPKVALSNMCDNSEPTRLEVSLVQKQGEQFIKLSPCTCGNPKGGKK
ncbi:hypothetical protein [Nitrosopumilus adriaticus]|uniref:Uncharacterized protein n=1 Tax=Nitrosopumilus adriaticus TaxID=1580092 RepID=A0A0D5C3Q7_9ARCH|nr:hypothetical protein [Nitrosopumilus adriaticus]AJW71037.1 hypothetical protein NADRNF5_1351 [Nitrosopumilus adriaticus]